MSLKCLVSNVVTQRGSQLVCLKLAVGFWDREWRKVSNLSEFPGSMCKCSFPYYVRFPIGSELFLLSIQLPRIVSQGRVISLSIKFFTCTYLDRPCMFCNAIGCCQVSLCVSLLQGQELGLSEDWVPLPLIPPKYRRPFWGQGQRGHTTTRLPQPSNSVSSAWERAPWSLWDVSETICNAF